MAQHNTHYYIAVVLLKHCILIFHDFYHHYLLTLYVCHMILQISKQQKILKSAVNFNNTVCNLLKSQFGHIRGFGRTAMICATLLFKNARISSYFCSFALFLYCFCLFFESVFLCKVALQQCKLVINATGINVNRLIHVW